MEVAYLKEYIDVIVNDKYGWNTDYYKNVLKHIQEKINNLNELANEKTN